MMHARKQQPVHDEDGELVGYLESSSNSEQIRVLDADGQQIAATYSITTGKRHLLNNAFNNKRYFTKAGGRRY